MFANATWSQLRVLSEYGRLTRLWVRFRGSASLGHRSSLDIDEGFDPLHDLASWVTSPIAWSCDAKGESGQNELDAAKKQALDAQATCFAERYNAPLDVHFD
eukprot:8129677-Pyramimonas_sp.AAC.1